MDELKHRSYIRRDERQEILTEARIMDGEQWHDCQIINISASGAKLRISSTFDQGRIMRLQIGNFGEFGCVVAWHNAQDLGVKFTHDPSEMADMVMGLAMYG